MQPHSNPDATETQDVHAVHPRTVELQFAPSGPGQAGGSFVLQPPDLQLVQHFAAADASPTQIIVNAKIPNDTPPNKPNVSMIFQRFAIICLSNRNNWHKRRSDRRYAIQRRELNFNSQSQQLSGVPGVHLPHR